MLKSREIRNFYINTPLEVPSLWNLSRKHIRIKTLDHRFIKLNKLENRINAKELRGYCIRYTPMHVYFSVLDWLFPERVGKKYKAKYSVPIRGEYVVDIDSHVFWRRHNHYYDKVLNICRGCLQISKELTLQVCEQIEEYYNEIAIVFSGKNGFHIHVLDFNLRDWTRYNPKNPIKSHETARFKFTKELKWEAYCFDRSHFIVSVDPMRVIAIPTTLNAESSLVCSYLGDRKDLEAHTIERIISKSQPMLEIHGHPEPIPIALALSYWW